MNNYSTVMDVLAVEHDWRRLVFQIAKSNPTAVVESARVCGWKHAPDFVSQCRDLVRNGQLIEAIKLYRNHTDTGLKEAKDAVEALK